MFPHVLWLPPGDLVLMSRAVRLMEGQRVVLNTNILLASDSAGRPEELLYTVLVPPRHGLVHAIQQPGVPLTTFTQLDVAAHRVCYTHDNSHHAEMDVFRSDTRNTKTDFMLKNRIMWVNLAQAPLKN